jgi:hypothetical protein
MRVFFLMAMLLASTTVSAQTNLSLSELLNLSFSASCKKFTPDVMMALGQVKQLENAIEQHRDSSQCNMNGLIENDLANFHNSLTHYQSYQDSYKKRLELEKKIAHNTVKIGDPGLDQSMIDMLVEDTILLQSELVEVDNTINQFSTVNGALANASYSILNGAYAYMNRVKTNPMCLNDLSGIIQPLSQAVSSAAYFINPVAGVAVQTAANLATIFSEIVRVTPLNKALKDIEMSNLSLSLSCATESMTQTFCEATSTMRMIDEYNNDYGDISDRFETMDLLVHDLVNTKRWFELVYSGSDINSEGNLWDRLKPFKQVNLLQQIEWTLQMVKAKGDEQLATVSGGPDALSNAIGIQIGDLTMRMRFPNGRHNDEVENPIFTTRNFDAVKFKLAGYQNEGIPICAEQRICNSIIEYLGFYKIKLTRNDWDAAYRMAKEIVKEEFDNAMRRLNERKTVDPVDVLMLTESSDVSSMSAYEELNNLTEVLIGSKDYLVKAKCTDEDERLLYCGASEGKLVPLTSHPYYNKIQYILDTNTMIVDIILLIQTGLPKYDIEEFPEVCSAIIGRSVPEDFVYESEYMDQQKAFNVLQCISKILHINQRGTSFFFDRIRHIVQYEVEARIENNDYDEEVQKILLASRQNLVEKLVAFYQTASGGQDDMNLRHIRNGLETSRNMSLNALRSFWDLFDNAYLKYFKNPDNSALSLDELCFSALSYRGKNARKFFSKIYSTCENAKLEYYDSIEPLVWKDFFVKMGRRVYLNSSLSEEDVLCSVIDFDEKLNILERRRRRNR